MYRVELHNTIDAPWTHMDPIRVGTVPLGAGTPGVYMTVARDGEPLARIDAWPLYGGPFTEFVEWRHYIVLGWNNCVHIVDPLARDVNSIECDLYFGQLYPIHGRLLIADASSLICVDELRRIVWRSDRLGLDGVIVEKVRSDGVIEGRGEWDPPGDWCDFRLSIVTGKPTL